MAHRLRCSRSSRSASAVKISAVKITAQIDVATDKPILIEAGDMKVDNNDVNGDK
jgi:hypothetical protein